MSDDVTVTKAETELISNVSVIVSVALFRLLNGGRVYDAEEFMATVVLLRA